MISVLPALAALPVVPDETYAVISVVAWTLSAVVINVGLSRLHERGTGDSNPYRIAVGLATSLVAGTVLLSPFVLHRLVLADFSLVLVASGLFTFPIGTGLYYHTAERYEDKAEIAAQFVKVKPIFSVTLALLLGEALTASKSVSLGLVVVGTLLLVGGTIRGQFSVLAFLTGLATALFWALGEAFVKIGLDGASSLTATYVALLTGTVIYLVVALPAVGRKVSIGAELRQPWVRPFALHGVLSFGIAYAAFFTSIQVVGLSRTALITAFWPVLAILLETAIKRLRGVETGAERTRYFVPAAVVLVTGSLVALVSPF